MAGITLGGNPISVNGKFPAQGGAAPDFTQTGKELKEITLADFAGKKRVLNLVRGLDTGMCVTSTKKFNEKAAGRNPTVALMISGDLPFATGRFFTGENPHNVAPLSTFRNRDSHAKLGVAIAHGPLTGLSAQCGGSGLQQQGVTRRAGVRDQAATEL